MENILLDNLTSEELKQLLKEAYCNGVFDGRALEKANKSAEDVVKSAEMQTGSSCQSTHTTWCKIKELVLNA
jgi:hypothetical protein